MPNYDIVVIGAGMAGSAAAAEMAKGAHVLLLEAEQSPGYHSTGRSAALHTENYGNDVIRRLTIASRDFFIDPPDGFSDHPVLTPRGVLWVGRADQQASFAAALAQGRQLVQSIAPVSIDDALKLCPVLRRDYVTSAMIEPDAMDLDVHAIHQGFLRELRRRAGTLITNARVEALTRRGSTWEVITDRDRYTAAVVVNAAGAWCDVIACLAGAMPVGLVPKRRTVVTFESGAVVDPRWPFILDVDEQFYFKPESGRILASPADETPVEPCDVQPEELDVAEAIDRVERATTFTVSRVQRKWAGLRSFVADKSPVVGMAPDRPGFFWLAGQGGYGIMTSPALARLSASLVLNGSVPTDLASSGISAAMVAPSRPGLRLRPADN
jgi:D-arginine dehydrogenase